MYGNSMCSLYQSLKNEGCRNGRKRLILTLAPLGTKLVKKKECGISKTKGNEKSFPFTIFLIRFWFDNFLPICNRCICTVFRDRFVSRADDLVYVDELLNTVGAPAGDTGDCEHRCKEFFRQIKHGVYETAVEIDIRAYTGSFRRKPVFHVR